MSAQSCPCALAKRALLSGLPINVRRRVIAQVALALKQPSGGSSPVQSDRGSDDLTGAVRVNVDALLAVTRHHDEFGGKASTFDVKLQTVALGVSDSGAAGAAAALGPTTADLVLVVGRKLADKVEVVAVAGATQLQLDVALATTRTVGRVAANSLGGPLLGTQLPATGPATGEFGEWASCLPQGRRYADRECRQQSQKQAAKKSGREKRK